MGAAKNDQTFSFDVVSCLIASLAESGVTVGAKQYALMAKIDASKSASGYEHMFRAVKARAKQINEQVSKGEIEVGATPQTGKKAKASSKAGTPASTAGRKRRKRAAAEVDGDDEEDVLKTPSKKVKTEATDGGELDLPSLGIKAGAIDGLNDDLFD